MKITLKRIFVSCLLVAFIIISWKYFVLVQDNYHLVDYSVSPDGQNVGVIIANMGGGGPGYCRDLIYNFPKRDFLPDFSKEKGNSQFFVKELNCGEAKRLKWNSGKLEIVRKQ